MPDRRARRLWLITAIANLVAAFACLGVGLVLAIEGPRPPPPPAHKVPSLPDAAGEGFSPIAFTPGVLDERPPAMATTELEDGAAVFDPAVEFARLWRVVFATVNGPAGARACILSPRFGGEQLPLEPGERAGSYLLLSIEPLPGSPRNVRLRFRELRRGVDVAVVFAASL
jgi:hypothetical protein